MMGGYPAELQKRLREKSAEDRAQAKLLIGMGLPFAAASVLGMSFALSMLLWFLKVPYLLAFPLAFLAVAGAVLFDTWKHPSAHWTVTRYYLAGTIDPRSAPAVGEGVLAGVPLMASVADPANLGTHGEKVVRGCANVVLGGARNVRAGLEQLKAARAREDQKVESAAVRFLAWLKEHEPATEEEVAELFRKDAGLGRGFALAHELGFVRRRKEGPQRLLEMKE